MDKKRQLLDAAERVYCSHGNLGLTVRRLAAEGDTTSQTIYTYFGSRDAVIVAMYDRSMAGAQRLLDQLGENLRSAAGGEDPRARLVSTALAYRAYCLENPAHFKMLAEGKGPEGTEPDEALRLQALGDGTLDFLLLGLSERARPEQQRSPDLQSALAVKFRAAFDALEREAAGLDRLAFGIGHIAVACACGYADFRYASEDWRNGRATLAAWHQRFAERASYKATGHADVY